MGRRCSIRGKEKTLIIMFVSWSVSFRVRMCVAASVLESVCPCVSLAQPRECVKLITVHSAILSCQDVAHPSNTSLDCMSLGRIKHCWFVPGCEEHQSAQTSVQKVLPEPRAGVGEKLHEWEGKRGQDRGFGKRERERGKVSEKQIGEESWTVKRWKMHSST